MVKLYLFRHNVPSLLITTLDGDLWSTAHPICFSAWKKPQYPLNRKPSEQWTCWGVWRRIRSLAPVGFQTLDLPFHSLLTIFHQLYTWCKSMVVCRDSMKTCSWREQAYYWIHPLHFLVDSQCMCFKKLQNWNCVKWLYGTFVQNSISLLPVPYEIQCHIPLTIIE